MRRQLPTLLGLAMLLAVGTLTVGGTAYGDDTEKVGKAEMAATTKATID